MSELQDKWAQDRLDTRDMVLSLVHDMEIHTKEERLPAAMRRKAQRFLDTYNKDPQYYQFDKSFLKRLNRFSLEIYHLDDLREGDLFYEGEA